ncbi:MAG: HD domain-containing protein [Bacilli bacterium]|nr:HD domain-containing protein [Bacilli bacterium]
MIDIENSKKLFQRYVNKYDYNDEKIFLKVYHTYRVLDNSIEIAKSLNLSESDVWVAALIGLLHDIGRFEQITKYNTFNDLKSVDHANLGIEILKGNNFIDSFVSDKYIQNIVLTAINNHNKYKIEDNLDKKTLMFCKIIRDADKLDIFKIFVNGDLDMPRTNSNISNRILYCYLKGIVLPDSFNETKMDFYLRSFGMLYDLNFKYSINKVIKDKIPDKLIDSIMENNMHEKDNLLEIKKVYYKKRGNLC